MTSLITHLKKSVLLPSTTATKPSSSPSPPLSSPQTPSSKPSSQGHPVPSPRRRRRARFQDGFPASAKAAKASKAASNIKTKTSETKSSIIASRTEPGAATKLPLTERNIATLLEETKQRGDKSRNDEKGDDVADEEGEWEMKRKEELLSLKEGGKKGVWKWLDKVE